MAVIEYDPFVLPFSLGVIILLGILLLKLFRWLNRFTIEDRKAFREGFTLDNTLASVKEVFFESLMHRKMFRRNFYLGYMHMTFAFGWLMLILIGNIESRVHSGSHMNFPYYPIFFKFFVHERWNIPGGQLFIFLMDFFLLFVLTGLGLALFKRSSSRIFGMKKTTKMHGIDRISLVALWMIFPMRLLAESFTSGYSHTGGFLTGTLGYVFASFLPVEFLAYPAWWAYSISLMCFFILLPFTRYMHIPAEVMLIFMRNYGMKTLPQSVIMTRSELNACSRCGLCIDTCQLKEQYAVAPAYFFREVREGRASDPLTLNCLLCGRCELACPVGLHPNEIRIGTRVQKKPDVDFAFPYLINRSPQHADVIYFAGCMTHLTPGIKNSMLRIMNSAKVDYYFMDEKGGVCCGRPLKMQGNLEAAKALTEHNLSIIKNTEPRILVTSCPICLKGFKEDYGLEIPVLHHSQFIKLLIEKKKLQLSKLDLKLAYHDPCELGRGCGIYDDPRNILQQIATLKEVGSAAENGDCCGGSLGSANLTSAERKLVTHASLKTLLAGQPDCLITACPLCKKTFQNATDTKVLDLAELVADSLITASEETVPEKIFTDQMAYIYKQ
ncbi:MAG: heterodisulfide reductase-related iron-sulfur binding cluster [Bacteroidota bacterium]